MFSLIPKIKRRIKKVLKVQSESRQLPRTSVHSRTRKLLLLLLASVLIGVFYPGEDLYDPLDMPREGEIAREDVIAPFQITVHKSDRELDEEEQMIRLTVPLVVDCDTRAVAETTRGLRRFLAAVSSLKDSTTLAGPPDQREFEASLSEMFPLLSRDAITESFNRDDLKKTVAVLEEVLREDIYEVGVMLDRTALKKAVGRNVLIRRGERENVYSRDRILSSAEANGRLLTALNHRRATDSVDVEYSYLVGHAFIKPNLTVNMPEYQHRLQLELSSIDRIREVVEEGEIIVRDGVRITGRQQAVLEQMARTMRTEAIQQGWPAAFLPVLARVVLVLAAFSSLYIFLYYFRREIFNSNPKLLALFLVFSLQLFLIHLLSRWGISSNLYPLAVLPVMVTILFDAEVGILSTLTLALLLGMMHRFDFTITLAAMAVGTVATLSSRRVRKRSHFFRIMLATAIASGLYVFLVEHLKFAPTDEILVEAGYGLVSGMVSVLLTIGVLPFFESLFGITTDITLLELSDMNHPLLKRLAVEAPGTYQHSIIVGNLSESAAKAIGANSLLARVGAYYHDIGKIEVPEYFVENQLSVKSKHDALSPSMSSLILSSHVKRGRQLGEEADIPDDVLNFVEEHHGTIVQSFFYNRALEQGEDPSVIDKYRYPGPKPQIRETAIAMLADAVEAASRTLDEPKPARIENLIQKIINDRFQSGELDQCPLTLKDLARIKEAFAQVLIASFHHRVVYPSTSGDLEAASE
ncbi:MAG: HDIG domain-containing protein [candidate division Zixibacteria bacterium]|nr:HDIG domain-containing protein [candidate division Zixibacteria bacterium]